MSRSDQNTRTVRYHSSDDMTGLGELDGVMEPVAVVIRPDGSVDVYGYIGVVDQRRGRPGDCEECAGPLRAGEGDGNVCAACTSRIAAAKS